MPNKTVTLDSDPVSIDLPKESTNLRKKKTRLINALAKSLESDPLQKSCEEISLANELALGESAAEKQGGQMNAVISFYRALMLYSDNDELLQVYKQTIPTKIYNLLHLLISTCPPTNVETLLPELQNKYPLIHKNNENNPLKEIPVQVTQIVDTKKEDSVKYSKNKESTPDLQNIELTNSLDQPTSEVVGSTFISSITESPNVDLITSLNDAHIKNKRETKISDNVKKLSTQEVPQFVLENFEFYTGTSSTNNFKHFIKLRAKNGKPISKKILNKYIEKWYELVLEDEKLQQLGIENEQIGIYPVYGDTLNTESQSTQISFENNALNSRVTVNFTLSKNLSKELNHLMEKAEKVAKQYHFDHFSGNKNAKLLKLEVPCYIHISEVMEIFEENFSKFGRVLLEMSGNSLNKGISIHTSMDDYNDYIIFELNSGFTLPKEKKLKSSDSTRNFSIKLSMLY